MELMREFFGARNQATQTVTNNSATIGTVGVFAIVIAIALMLLMWRDRAQGISMAESRAASIIQDVRKDVAHAVELMAAERRADAIKVDVLLRESAAYRARIELLEVQYRKIEPRVSALETK